MKKYLHFLALAAIIFSFTARGDTSTTGGARVLENPTSNGDLKLRVKIGSTPTDAVVVTGSSGAVTTGPGTPVTGANFLTYGSIQSFAQGSTDKTAVFFGDSSLDLGVNFYRDSAGGKAFATKTGAAILEMARPTTGTDDTFFFLASTSAQTAGSALAGNTTLGSIKANGSWTIGPASGTVAHTFQSGQATQLNLNSASTFDANFHLAPNAGAGSTDWYMIGAASGDLKFVKSGAATTIMSLTQAGTVTIGPSGGNTTHAVRGAVQFGGYSFNTFNPAISSTMALTIANLGTYSIGTNSLHGILFIISDDGGAACQYYLRGGINTTAEMSDALSSCTPTSGNAGTTNVYYSSGYKIENRTGGSRNYGLTFISVSGGIPNSL